MTMMDDFDLDDMELEDESPPEEASNRTFLLVAGILGAILILSLICMAVYAMYFVPKSRDAKDTQVAEINAQNTVVAFDSAMTAEAQAWTATPTKTPTRAPITATPSPTPVLAPTDTPAAMDQAATQNPHTATVAALLTQQAANALTTTPSPTQLPSTGFADDVGIPGLLALAASLVLIIFFARRMRAV